MPRNKKYTEKYIVQTKRVKGNLTYLLILIGRDGGELCFLEYERLYGSVVYGSRLVLSLSYHDVYPGLVAVHGVQNNLGSCLGQLEIT